MLYQFPLASSRSCFAVRDAPRPGDDFLDDLREFISLRLDRVDPYRESEEYCRQQEKASRLYERLRETLPKENQATLLEYSEALGAAHYLETALLAEKAFTDGMRIIVRVMINVE